MMPTLSKNASNLSLLIVCVMCHMVKRFEPYYLQTLPLHVCSRPPPISVCASCLGSVTCMLLGEGQRFFVMQKLAVGGRKGEREETEGERGGDREQDITNLHLPFLPHFVVTLHSLPTTRSTLLRMLVPLICSLAACANVMPVKDFEVDRV